MVQQGIKYETNNEFKIHCKLRAGQSNEELRANYRSQCLVVKKVVCKAIINESTLILCIKSNRKILQLCKQPII